MAVKQNWIMTSAPTGRRSVWWPWGAVLLAESLVALLVILGAAGLWLYSGQLIMPGVHSLGVNLGGASVDKATLALQYTWAHYNIILRAGDAAYTVTPEALGITLDAQATALAAYQQGRSLDALKGVDILPVLSVDLGIAHTNLQAWATHFERPPVDAGLRVVGGRIQMTPATAGQSLDLTATLTQLEQNAAGLVAGGQMDVVVRPVQPAITDASAVAAQVEQLLIGPLTMRAYDPLLDQAKEWTVNQEVWAEWLVLGVSPQDASRLNWGIDPSRLETFLATQASEMAGEQYLDANQAATAMMDAIITRQPTVRLRVYHHPRQHSVQSGETLASIGRDYGLPYAWLQYANPGVGDSLSIGQVLAIPSPDDLLPLPVVEHKRVVVSIGEQKMWAYENGALKWEWPVSTGIASSPTSPGVFQIQTHESNAYAANWDLWMPYFMGIYRPAPTVEFMNGFHGFPSRNGTQLLWTNNLGKPVTYGCILLSTDNAALLYAWAEEGVVVEIK